MADLVQQLGRAARDGDAAGLTACLAAGADVNGLDSYGKPALWWSIHEDHPRCVAALLEAGADPNAADHDRHTPLLEAITRDSLACVQLLLGAGANPLAVSAGMTTVEHAAYTHQALLPALLQAVPAQALDADGARLKMELLGVMVHCRNLDCARYLLAECAPPAAGNVLAVLTRAGAWAQPLYAILASRQALTQHDWGLVPSPCDGLAAALPAVLQRSTAEAARLVQHLPAADRERLRTAALCLGRAQRLANAPLPTPIMWHLLLLSVADSAAEVPAPDAAGDAAPTAAGAPAAAAAVAAAAAEHTG